MTQLISVLADNVRAGVKRMKHKITNLHTHGGVYCLSFVYLIGRTRSNFVGPGNFGVNELFVATSKE